MEDSQTVSRNREPTRALTILDIIEQAKATAEAEEAADENESTDSDLNLNSKLPKNVMEEVHEIFREVSARMVFHKRRNTTSAVRTESALLTCGDVATFNTLLHAVRQVDRYAGELG